MKFSKLKPSWEFNYKIYDKRLAILELAFRGHCLSFRRNLSTISHKPPRHSRCYATLGRAFIGIIFTNVRLEFDFSSAQQYLSETKLSLRRYRHSVYSMSVLWVMTCDPLQFGEIWREMIGLPVNITFCKGKGIYFPCYLQIATKSDVVLYKSRIFCASKVSIRFSATSLPWQLSM